MIKKKSLNTKNTVTMFSLNLGFCLLMVLNELRSDLEHFKQWFFELSSDVHVSLANETLRND